MAARQLGFSHLLLILIRIYTGMYFGEPAAYRVCHISFVIVFFHFLWERFGTQTIGSRNLSVSEIVAMITIWWMFVFGRGLAEAPLLHDSMYHHLPH